MLFEFLSEMKEEEFPIAFSKTINSYYYAEEEMLIGHLFKKPLFQREMKVVNGGESFSKCFQDPIIPDCEIVTF